MSELTPSMAQAIKDAMDDRLLDFHTTMIARVVKVDVSKALCDVQPVLKRKYGDGTITQLPVITNVPIAFYRANDAFISLPVKVGDYVKLEFSERSIDLWLEKGGIVDPEDPRKFNLTDAIAYPGVYPKNLPPTGATADDIFIKNKNSTITIKPDGEIELKGSAIKALADLVVLSGEGDAVALASKVLDELTAIKSAYDSHTHTYSPGPGGPTPTAPPAVPMTAPTSPASTKVKAE